MALGTAKFFGFDLPPNFRLPYLATSISDFWRRWHLSLSTWLRDYLYFPLGGSRYGTARTYFNLMFVFILCGLWHGATWNWLVYGAFNGVLMSLHRAYDQAVSGIPWMDTLRGSGLWKVISWIGTAYQFLIGLILVRMVSWDGGLLMMRSLTGVAYESNPASSPGFAIWDPIGVPLIVPVLIVLGLSGHTIGLLRSVGLPIPDRSLEPLRMISAAIAVASVIVFSPGVAKTFIYIQF
jgi:D-alanyl-lipoteichoic acid acyltransferase DltB (MBOAT superfamily)